MSSGKVMVTHGGSVYLSSLTVLPDGIQFNNQGYVDLSSLTVLPDGIQFNNQGYVYLSSLTVLPDGIQFNNQGNVDLSSLTVLPDGIQFNNQGYVYLSSLTVLPDGIQFNNQGYVDLSSLTVLPDGIQFNNQGCVYLSSLISQTQTYRGKQIRLSNIDGYTMLIGSKRNIGDHKIMKARYFGGGDIAKLKQCFIAQAGDFYAHGDTAEKALRDVRFKEAQVNFDATDLVAEIKRRQTVTFNDFRLLTGACESGLTHGMAEAGIDTSVAELPLPDVLRLANGQFGVAFRRAMA
jgi:hypothetical protein